MLRVLGSIVYVLVLFPVGIIARIIGYDLLRKQWNERAGSGNNCKTDDIAVPTADSAEQ